MIRIFISLLLMGVAITPALPRTVYKYDKYGKKIGSYKQTTSGYIEYDKYGRVNSTYKQKGNSMIKYNKYGTVIEVYGK